MDMIALAVAWIAFGSAGIAGPSEEPATRVFAPRDLGLTFRIPVQWTVRETRGRSVITIPLPETRDTAVVEVFATQFRQSAETWQGIQKAISEQMGREVERQWTETILEVPLLMTRIRYLRGAEPAITLVGLMYSEYANKLHFRLTAPAQHFALAEAQWRSALATLRTVSGEMPRPHDVTRPADSPPPLRPVEPPRQVVLGPEPDRRGRPRLGEVEIPLTIARRLVSLRLPRGWGAEPAGDARVLVHPRLRGSATLEGASTLDSADPDKALAERAAKGLSEFVSVRLREEPRPFLNQARARVASVRRFGASQSGPWVAVTAVGAKGAFYWILDYRGTADQWRSDRGLVEELLDRTSLEGTP